MARAIMLPCAILALAVSAVPAVADAEGLAPVVAACRGGGAPDQRTCERAKRASALIQGGSRSVFVVPPSLDRAWKAHTKSRAATLAPGPERRPVLHAVMADIAAMGFDSVVVSSYNLERATGTPSPDYTAYLRDVAAAAHAASIDVLAYLPWHLSRKGSEDIHVQAVRICSDPRAVGRFLNEIRDLDAILGVVCPFESWGKVTRHKLDAEPKKLRSVRRRANRRGYAYFNIAASGTDPPDAAFDAVVMQINPYTYREPGALDAYVRESVTRGRGVQMTLNHNMIGLAGFGGEQGRSRLYGNQYRSLLAHRPHHLNVFDYQPLLIEGSPDRHGRTVRRRGRTIVTDFHYFTPRAVVESLVDRLADPRLVFSDPLDSAFASAILGNWSAKARYAPGGHGGDEGALVKDVAAVDQATRIVWTRRGLPHGKGGAVSFWFKTAPSASVPAPVLTMSCKGTPRCVGLSIGEQDGPDDGDGAETSVVVNLTANAWHHIALVWGAGDTRMFVYVDGTSHGAAARVSGDLGAGVVSLTLEAGPARGFYDNIRVYDAELAPNEVRRLASGSHLAAAPKP